MKALYIIVIQVFICLPLSLWTQQAEDELKTGDLRLFQNNYPAAVLAYTSAIERDARLWKAYLGRGMAYAKLGDYTNAIADYTQVISLSPYDPEAYYLRAGAQ